MTELNDILTLIAAQIKCEASELIAYAQEDNLGGYHWNPALSTFKQGSCFGVEGQMLYALVRHLKPDVVVEIGGWAGCSGAHLAAAVIKNGVGHVYSIDNEIGGQVHGADLPEAYKDVVTLIRANGQEWLIEQPDNYIGLLFEDADHSTALVAEISKIALRKLEQGGYLVNHDAAHDFAYDGNGAISTHSMVGREVREGLALAGAYFRVYRAEPSDCGIALTVIPGVRVDKHSVPMSQRLSEPKEHIGNANIESLSKPPVPIETKLDQKPKVPRGKEKRKSSVK